MVNKQLNCGHYKLAPCKSEDVECNEPVEVLHPVCEHILPVPCYLRENDIVLRSIKCQAEPMKTLKCGHELRLPCGREVDDVKCKTMVDRTLPCGHAVIIRCSSLHPDGSPREKCTRDCLMPLDCGHFCSIPCHNQTDAHVCKSLVPKELKCGHRKVNLLHTLLSIDVSYVVGLSQQELPCFRPTLNEICFQPVSLPRPCGHAIKGTCGEISMSDVTKECDELVIKSQSC